MTYLDHFYYLVHYVHYQQKIISHAKRQEQRQYDKIKQASEPSEMILESP